MHHEAALPFGRSHRKEQGSSRPARRLKLGAADVVAFIGLATLEGAFDGKPAPHRPSDAEAFLDRGDAMALGADSMLVIPLEAIGPDGTKLVISHQVIA